MTGKLKIILGYAAGTGKTYRMLDEGQKLAQAGCDVVIGYFEPHGRKDTIAMTEGLETVARRVVEYRGRTFEEMDTAAILKRRPAVCLVDEFPHTNVPGCERSKRWEDVMALLESGIDVITTMNIQHLESLNDPVREITGVAVRETVPDWVIKSAAELVLVDVTPGALLNRLDRGVVYAPDKAERAKQNFFKAPALAALREMAMRQVAHEVEVRQESAQQQQEPFGERERILIHVTASPASAAVIRRGRRVADYLRADCFAVAFGSGEALERHLEFARRMRIETRVLNATASDEEDAAALVDFAHRNAITQIFLEKPPKIKAWRIVGSKRGFAMRVLSLARSFQVTFVADRTGGPS